MFDFFFCDGQGLNLKLCVYYGLSLPTELSSSGHILCLILKVSALILIDSFS